jgi:hypothetical protein
VAEEEASFLEALEIDGELGDVAHRNDAAERAADLNGLDL